MLGDSVGEQIVFHNPSFRSGINIAIRIGDEWFTKTGESNSENGEIPNSSHHFRVVIPGSNVPMGDAFIYARAYMPLGLVPEDWLKDYYHHGCMNHLSVVQYLQEDHDETVTMHTMVTVLFFLFGKRSFHGQ